jgi:hypothetical protein
MPAFAGMTTRAQIFSPGMSQTADKLRRGILPLDEAHSLASFDLA